jgi:hypothetical protein
MKIIVLVPEAEKRLIKKGDVIDDYGRLHQTRCDLDDEKYPCYQKHEIEVPEWATTMTPIFKGEIHYGTAADPIPIPQPEKRCRWRRDIHGLMMITEKEYTEKEIDAQAFGTWEPVE